MNITKKVAFVTGSNRGIGFEAARELAEKNVHVIISSRDEKSGLLALNELSKKGLVNVSLLTFDVSKPEDHKKAFNFITEKFGHLDILINNAGVWLDETDVALGGNKTSTTSIDIIRKTFDINFFSLIELTQILLPLIKKSEAGRIVNLSSVLGSQSYHADPQSMIYNNKAFAYNASKVALNTFTIHLAHELKNTNIKVNSAHPGWVKTDLGGPKAMIEIVDGGKTSVMLALLNEDGPTGGFFHLDKKIPW